MYPYGLNSHSYIKTHLAVSLLNNYDNYRLVVVVVVKGQLSTCGTRACRGSVIREGVSERSQNVFTRELQTYL